MEITGAVSGHSDDPWRDQSAKGIGFSNPHRDAGDFTNLSFFTVPYPNGPFREDSGLNCFGSQPSVIQLFAGSIKKGKGGRAEGHFFFEGYTKIAGSQLVVYQLTVLGQFDPGDDWLPASGNTTSMTMIDWELTLANEGADVRNISCIGEGNFADFEDNRENNLPDTVIIVVTRTN